MLTHLGIQGLAIIESLNIEFAHGFNVITGETGAGKSILIKALGLLLGGKSSPESVRKGFEQATVSGRFVVRKNHPAMSLLTELGVTAEEDEHGFGVIVRRLVTSKGRSSAWINDTPVTTTSLKQLSETLIDIFGQHDNHRLLDVAFHSHYLDQFIKTKTLPKSLEDKWRETSNLLSDLRSFIEKLRGSGQESDYISYRLSELRTFNPTDEDYKSMLGLNERAKSALGMTSAIQHAMSALEDESGFSVAKRVREVARALINSKVSTLLEIASEASKIAESLDELSYSIGKVSANVDVSEEDIDAAETRIAGYQALFRKNAATDVESLVAEWNKLEAQMAALSDATGHIEALVTKFESLVEEVLVIAKKLA